MPRLSTWFVRAALFYLATGFTFGALLLLNKGLGIYPQIWTYLPVHMELLLMGWLAQLAMGMIFWIFPRLTKGPPRGNETLAWLAFALFNLGLALVASETVFAVRGLTLAGRVVEIAGIILFVLSTWKRVRSFRG